MLIQRDRVKSYFCVYFFFKYTAPQIKNDICGNYPIFKEIEIMIFRKKNAADIICHRIYLGRCGPQKKNAQTFFSFNRHKIN